ncbi:PqqD family peptide modification chaperone [Emticicia sp. 17c]|uniref:PqqD family peptide modification chaperone n=1 Tax=Emticicia sp. 17c TaxID=3127704 RepID=UPI00301C5088
MNDLQSILKRNDENFLVNTLGEESVMMNLKNGDFMGLNTVATDIWELLKEPTSAESLIQKLIDKYEVEESVCITETMTYINKMMQEKMVLQVTA